MHSLRLVRACTTHQGSRGWERGGPCSHLGSQFLGTLLVVLHLRGDFNDLRDLAFSLEVVLVTSSTLPNMRVQRTRRPSLRSGRSRRSLGSPLTRYPLGSPKEQHR